MYDFIPKYPFFVKLKKLKKNYFEVLPFTIESWGKKQFKHMYVKGQTPQIILCV